MPPKKAKAAVELASNPKKKTKHAKAAAATDENPSSLPPTQVDAVNAEHLAWVVEVEQTIKDKFADIMSAAPKSLSLPVFDASAYKAAIQNDEVYMCSENFMKVSLTYSARARIPVISSRIHDLIAGDFAKPCKFPDVLRIAVLSKTWDPQAHCG
eukprot:523206-Amphidinium_carterae.1